MNSLGEVKLTDFGISKQLGSTVELTGTFVGTMTYMSPERINCKPYTYASDIWSLGIIMYEMAVGTLPFPACKRIVDAIQYIGTSTDIVLPQDIPLSLELRNLVEYW
jgi:serine/threonine protein kinase